MRSKILLVVSWSILLFEVSIRKRLNPSILAGITFAEWPPDPTGNVPICTAEEYQEYPQLVSDGAGSVIISTLALIGASVAKQSEPRIDSKAFASVLIVKNLTN